MRFLRQKRMFYIYCGRLGGTKAAAGHDGLGGRPRAVHLSGFGYWYTHSPVAPSAIAFAADTFCRPDGAFGLDTRIFSNPSSRYMLPGVPGIDVDASAATCGRPCIP